MKAMKLAMVAILIAGTMACLANADGWGIKPKAVYNLTLIKALTIPGLATAIVAQVDPGFLNNNQQAYTVSVHFNGALYRITGTEVQWRLFFYPKWKVKSEIKPVFTTKQE